MSEVIRIFTSGRRRLRTVQPAQTRPNLEEGRNSLDSYGVANAQAAAVATTGRIERTSGVTTTRSGTTVTAATATTRASTRPALSFATRTQSTTSEISRTADSVLVVKPNSPTYVLSGRTLLSFSWGRHLMVMRWPFIIPAVLSRIILVLLRHTELFSEGHLARGSAGREVRVPLMLAGGHVLEALCALCFLVELFLMAHVVHRQLLNLTLSSFDPWVITLCMLRAVASHLFSRAELTGDGWMEGVDAGYMIISILWTALMVLLEAAELARVDKVALLLTNCAICGSLLMHVIWKNEPVDWDPDGYVSIWWLAPMTFQSQFISAMLSVVIYLGKAILNFVIRGRSFMFLRAHYALDVTRVEELFEQFDVDGDGKITCQEWNASLSNLGIPQSHLAAGFKQLDPDATGTVRYQTFRLFLGELCELHPGMDQAESLALFCREAWYNSSGTVSLARMVEAVTAQWQKVQLKPFSEDFHARLLQSEDIRRLLKCKGDVGDGSAVMLSGLVSMAIQWLGAQDFLRLESDMLQLGMKHAKRGITLPMLSIFQESLFSSLKSQLGDAFLEHEWAFVWMHFITSPLMRGLARGTDLGRSTLVSWALADSAPAEPKGSERWPCRPTALSEIMRGLDCELRRTDSHKIADSSMNAAHNAAVAGLLKGILEELVKGDSQQARVAVRRSVGVHWEYDLTALDLARFQEAFLRAVRSVHQGAEGYHKKVVAWTWILQMEVIDVFLMAPYAELEDMLSMLPVEDPCAPMNQEQWVSLLHELSVAEDLARGAYGKLCPLGGPQLTFECVKAAILSESMISPGRCLSQVVADWCTANS